MYGKPAGHIEQLTRLIEITCCWVEIARYWVELPHYWIKKSFCTVVITQKFTITRHPVKFTHCPVSFTHYWVKKTRYHCYTNKDLNFYCTSDHTWQFYQVKNMNNAENNVEYALEMYRYKCNLSRFRHHTI